MTVYNGWDIVPRALTSAAELSTVDVDVDVLVLDDASPDLEFARHIEAMCADLGMEYYRTPRNLGIVRNVNLGLLRARSAGYDGVIVSNSDVIYSRHFAERLWQVVKTDPTIGSVTAWSTNVSVYSLPNENPDEHLSTQAIVDEVADVLFEEFGTTSIDIPAGISFAMLITAEALVDVGLMDPVFGRGYCEETDWSRRCLASGHRLVLAPGTFVYHAGQGSTVEAGMLSGGHTTVPENEAIIDLRYPDFRTEVGAFVDSGILTRLWARATEVLVSGRAQGGYVIDITGLERPAASGPEVVRSIATVIDATDSVQVSVATTALGFSDVFLAPFVERGGAVVSRLGCPPRAVRLFQLGPAAEQWASSLTGEGGWVDERGYPEHV